MQYSRNYELKILNITGGTATTYTAGKGFNMEFSISRSTDEAPDSAQVTIYNLDAPEIFEGDRSRVEIYAAYGTELAMLYSGDIIGARQRKKGSDNSLFITCGDGKYALDEPIQKSYTQGTSPEKIIDDIVKTMKNAGAELASGTIAKAKELFKGKKTASPISLKDTKKALSDLFSGTGYSPKIINNELNLVNRKTKAIDDFVLFLDSGNGLIGSPQQGFTVEEGKKTTSLEFETLINTAIVPGRRVDIEGFGKWIIRKIQISGSTRGTNWYMRCEATQ
jgi:hypothetical protein